MITMEKLWKKNLINITPYVAGEQPKNDRIIKLNANESPFPPSPAAIEAINAIDGMVRKYPSSDSAMLRKTLAGFYGVSDDSVFVGDGSDDVLALAFRAFFNSDKPIFFPDITYSFYPVWCELLKIPYKTIPVRDDFTIDPADYAPENGGVVIANPNAPTSIGEGREFIEGILDENRDVIVIVDEASVDFGGYSSIEKLGKYDNLLVVQTMSKSRSLAGMRVGMAIGSPELISVLTAVKDSYNSYPVNCASQAAAEASVKDDEYFRTTVAKVMELRDELKENLRALGFVCPDSRTNFIFCTHPDRTAKEIFSALREKGIFVRWFDKDRIDNYLRITVGTKEQNEILLSEIKNILQ